MRRLALAATAAAILALWWSHRSSHAADPDADAHAASSASRGIGSGFSTAMQNMHARGATIPMSVQRSGDDVVIAGKVFDEGTTNPVPDVEVVFRSPAGEESTTTGADGVYRMQLHAGVYRAFVRDDSVLSVGRQDMVRIPGLPSPDAAGVPDEELMPLVVATSDSDNVDLPVTRGGTVHGKVVDKNGRPIPGVVLLARNGPVRPALGTDVAESDANGEFDLQLPAGEYEIVATHARYAGLTAAKTVEISAGAKETTEVVMTAGCVIEGKVVDANGRPSNDGAIEQQLGDTMVEFSPAGRIEADGTFRWVTTEETTVELRAWPWKSPPSAVKTFACRDGARFEHVVFQLPNQAPDLDGTLVDENGQPVPFAYLDINPTNGGSGGQQERTDAEGHWQVFSMPAGQYMIVAQAPEHGVVHDEVQVPAHGVALKLGGVGRIEGTTTALVNGSFELTLGACVDEQADNASVQLPGQHRVVTVAGGHFIVERVPACTLVGSATWRDQTVPFSAEVATGGTGHVELELGPPHPKHIHGIVRDEANRPVAHAEVSATQGEHQATATTDAVGRFTMDTFSGANVFANANEVSGYAVVSSSTATDEEIDITVTRFKPENEYIEAPEGPSE